MQDFSPQALELAKTLDARKAEEILLIDVGKSTIIADCFIVCSGRSTVQVKMLADEADEAARKMGLNRLRIEGYQAGRWIVLDFGDILVHIFHKEEREFYDIERLWRTESNSMLYAGDAPE